MAEVLTESYCERCGAKFTFDSSARTGGTFLRARTFARGLRNYLTSDESLDDALEEARREQDRKASGAQLQAFHGTFSFCFTCRQYTCRDCWNEAAGRCRTCAPMPEAPDPLEMRDLAAAPTRLEELPEPESWVAERLGPSMLDVPALPVGAPTGVAPATPLALSESLYGAIEAGEEPALEPVTAAATEAELGSGPGAEAASAVVGVAPEFKAADASAALPVGGAPVATHEPNATLAEPSVLEPESIAAAWAASPDSAAVPEPVELEPDLVAAISAPEPEAAAEDEPLAGLEPAAAEARVPQLTDMPVPAAEVAPVLGVEVAAPLAPAPEPLDTGEYPAEPAAVASVEAPGPAASEAAAEFELVGTPLAPEPEVAAMPVPELMSVVSDLEAPGGIEHAAALSQELTPAVPAPEPEAVAPLEVVEPAPEPETASKWEADAEPEPTVVVPAPEPRAAATLEPPKIARHEPERPPEIVPPPPIAPVRPARLPQIPLRQPKPPAQGIGPWQVVAPDEARPQSPARPGVQPADDTPHGQARWLARRRENAQPQVSARITHNIWEESTRDLVSHTGSGIQACQSCSLPLSANARFCRRCGSRQG